MIEDQLAALVDGQKRTNELLAALVDGQGEPQEPGEPHQPGPGGPLVVVPVDDVRPVDVLPIAADWTLTLPIGKPNTTNSPWNDYLDRLNNGRAPGMFYPAMVGGRRAVVFDVRDPNNGVTTKNSNYPRSELREMIAGRRWDEAARESSVPFVSTAELAIVTAGLVTRPRVVGWQIHGGDDDVCQVVADEQGRLGVAWRDGDAWLTLRERYAGEPFRLRVENTGKAVTFSVDGQPAGQITPGSGSGWYVKAGCYVQTGGRSKHREPATALGRVIYWSLDVQPRAA